ncbi:hypothetical protein CEXT_53861 [Caerostris extrusa]|uniref:Uncharacterized protein n=1 Tax=Caerostris extrusa TaxID=172846 RepID=A0AAV4TTY5_CAEEX|nr:hypothetical protein CEXT_53861 [Caerostris extrusa]
MEVPNLEEGEKVAPKINAPKKNSSLPSCRGGKGSHSRIVAFCAFREDGACSIRRGENPRAPYVRRMHLDNGWMGLNSYREGDSFTLELFYSQNKGYVQNQSCPPLL